jgi:hypothetical protein
MSWAHTFIVRIRFQPREIPGAPPVWYGTVVHLPSGTVRRVNTLVDITAFMTSILDGEPADGASPPPPPRPDA